MAQQNSSEEVDLGYLFRSIGGFFKKIAKLLFLIIGFFRKYAVITIALIIIGFGVGFYLDSISKPIFNNELIVIPNFESTDYLYSEAEMLNMKREANDSIFLKTLFKDDYKDFIKIEIEPIIDVYGFTAEKKDNIETLKILYNDKDPEEFLKDKTISKYYKYHQIHITFKGYNSESLSNDLLEYFNNNEHFLLYQKVGLKDTEIQIAQNEKMISQIDSVMKAVSENTEKSQAQSVYISTQSDLYQMINTKQALLNNRLKLQTKYIDQNEIIKLVSGNYNLEEQGISALPNKIKTPIYLLLFFSFFSFLIYLYKKLKEISKED
ncbi:DUF2273 domain-containing protein [Gelidibacter japonicus]|uniref:DUF2273 domain-containing protein n=1 Tax=Gelidibacter japonicus TaxID=1962232 RepID=UPI003A936708